MKFLNHYIFWMVNSYFVAHPQGAFKKIDAAVSLWPHITKGKHLYGSIEWRYKYKPIGHIHGNHVVDILFPKDIQTKLLADGLVQRNKYVSNGISLYLKTVEDVGFAIKLLNQSYDLVKLKTDKRKTKNERI